MQWFHSSRSPKASSSDSSSVDARASGTRKLSPNAQAWRRLVVQGYGRTGEEVRATQPAPLQRELDDNART